MLHLTDQGQRYLDLHPSFLVLISKALPVWMLLNPLLCANNCRRFLIELAEHVVQLYKSLITARSTQVSCVNSLSISMGLEGCREKRDTPSLHSTRADGIGVPKLVSFCFSLKIEHREHHTPRNTDNSGIHETLAVGDLFLVPLEIKAQHLLHKTGIGHEDRPIRV
jgi:hypothetical protein